MSPFNRLVGRRTSKSQPAGPQERSKQRRALVRAAAPVLESLERRQLLAAVVTTDLPDYAPGETALFSAFNDEEAGTDFDFAAGEKVQFQVLRADGEPNVPPGHEPWRVVDGGTESYLDSDDVWVYADLDGVADGRVETSWYVHEQFLGAELELTAAGMDSGAAAAAQFRDGLDFTTFKLYTPTTFAAPSTLATLVGFEIKTTAAADQFKKVDFFTWTGSTFSTNVFPLRLYYKTSATAPTSGEWSASSPGTQVALQTGSGKNEPDGSGKIIIEPTSTLNMAANTYYQFFVVAEVRPGASNNALLKLRFGQSSAIDFNGGKANPTTANTLGTVTVDTVAPVVSSINRANASPTNASSVNFTATFSELVSGVDAGDFALATTGVSGASITSVTAIGAATVLNGVSYYTSYSVTVNTGTGNGTIGLNFVDNDTALDRAGHRAGGTGLGNGNFTGQVYTIEKVVATSLSADAASGTFGGSTILTATLSSGGLGVSGKQVDFTLDGNAVGSAVTDIFGVATLNGVSLDGFNAGTHSGVITASFAGDSTHSASNGSSTLTVDKADAVIVVDGTTVSYDGGTYGATGSATGVLGESLAGLDLGDIFTNAGTHAANWTFTDVTGNYNDASGTATIQIDKADAVIVVDGTTVSYDGGTYGATGSATGVLGESLAGLDLGDIFTNAGTHAANWTFTDVTGNYNDASGTATIQIDKADAVIVVDGTTVSYDGGTYGATGSATGVLSESLAGLDLGDSFTNAGTHTANWTFTDVTGNYNDASGTVEVVINQAQAVLNWGAIGPIAQGTSLDGLLNTSSDVAGTWTYTIEDVEVDNSSVLVAGSYVITATFTPDSANYLGGTITNNLTVESTGVEVIASLVQENMNLALNGHFGIRLTTVDGTSLQTGVFEDLGIVVGSYTAYSERIEMDADGISVIAVFRMTAELRNALADLATSGDDDVTLTAGPGNNIFVNLSVGLTGTYDGEDINGSATMDFFVNNSLRALLAELRALL